MLDETPSVRTPTPAFSPPSAILIPHFINRVTGANSDSTTRVDVFPNALLISGFGAVVYVVVAAADVSAVSADLL